MTHFTHLSHNALYIDSFIKILHNSSTIVYNNLMQLQYVNFICFFAYILILLTVYVIIFHPIWSLPFIMFKEKACNATKSPKGAASGEGDGEDPIKKWIKYLLILCAAVLALGIGYLIWCKWGGFSEGCSKSSNDLGTFNPSLDRQYVHPNDIDQSILDKDFWWPNDPISGQPLVGNKEYLVYYLEKLKYTEHLLQTNKMGVSSYSTQSLLSAADDRHSILIIQRYGEEYITLGEFKYSVKLDNPINNKAENLAFAKDNLIFSESIRGHYINGNIVK